MAMVFELRAETENARGSIARVGHPLGINTETITTERRYTATERPKSHPVPGS